MMVYIISMECLGKCFFCCYCDSYGCEKIFIIFGYVLWYLKIYMVEKVVLCLFVGCIKKFICVDNMKQYFEIYYKDKVWFLGFCFLFFFSDRRGFLLGKFLSCFKLSIIVLFSNNILLFFFGGVWDLRDFSGFFFGWFIIVCIFIVGFDVLVMVVVC